MEQRDSFILRDHLPNCDDSGFSGEASESGLLPVCCHGQKKQHGLQSVRFFFSSFCVPVFLAGW